MTNLKIDLVDHYDTSALAKADLDWATYGLEEIRQKLKELKDRASRSTIGDIEFNNIEQFLSILNHTMNDRFNYWVDEEERIKKLLVENGELSDAN
ncbi:hypothetical protein JGA56_16385 [Acinetobacter baumannii]|uniref:hypothetical protein n=1 Tax=Acinetobacter baumannii TaxID=470 RepID=UPI0018EB2DCC|nr:hypothetical protein [Acinetobacter baumannii]MBJ3829821.1 hypothetical protein [Acinetobacter baumannii]